ILIGPGMVRSEKIENLEFRIWNLDEILKIEDEGVQTYFLTKYLLQKYPDKKWVIDAGALQMLELEWIPKNAILTPHQGEWEKLKLKMENGKYKNEIQNLNIEQQVELFTKEYQCVILLKG